MAKLNREKGGEFGSATAFYGTGYEARYLTKNKMGDICKGVANSSNTL